MRPEKYFSYCQNWLNLLNFRYPREEKQGREFEETIAPVHLILYFECSDETLVSRIKARAAASTEVRADDNEETLKTRIKTFRENTEKILVQYPTKLKRVNAERPVDDIFADVSSAIDETLAKKWWIKEVNWKILLWSFFRVLKNKDFFFLWFFKNIYA